MNYLNGYNKYCGEDVFSLGFPKAKTMRYGPGIIIAVDNYEFKHNIPTNEGSSGSPICLINNSLVIGIHKQGDPINKVNKGTFIEVIVDKMNNIRQNKRKFVAQNKNLLFNDLFFMSNNYKKDNINLNDFDNFSELFSNIGKIE